MLDLHSHTKYSADSAELPENQIEAAIKKGCRIFGFSEHLDYDYTVNNLEVIMTDVDAYYNNTKRLKKEYEEKIKLLCAIEFAYDKKAEPYYIETEGKYKFDYIINSVHVANGLDCYFQPYFEGKTKKQAYGIYLQQVLNSIDASYDYQIAAHIGYVARNAPYKDPYLYYEEHKDIIDGILKRIIERGKTLEVNTNVKTSKSLYLPTYEIIKRYYEMGGRLVTFGSDCHQAARVCGNYTVVTDMLKSAGFTELAYFENKQIKFYKI